MPIKSRLSRQPLPDDLPDRASRQSPSDVSLPSPGDDIPAHVWALLQEAGEAAAEHLRDILRSPAFSKMAATSQARLIDLAFTRAYGLPVRRSVEVKVDGDAVAASLHALADALPERQATGRGPTTIDGETAADGDPSAAEHVAKWQH